MTTEPTVSLREFARMTGTSDGAVRKAILRGSIKEGLDADKKIIPSVASLEWGKPIITADDTKPEPAPAAIAQVVSPAAQVVTDDPSDDDVFSERYFAVDDAEEIEPVVFSDGAVKPIDDTSEFQLAITDSMPKADADRLISVYKARKAKRELQQLEGELVDKGLVYQNLFEFAAKMRNTFLNIPDRVVDNMLAADNRNDAASILTEEINSVLISLARIGQIKLTQDDI